MSTGFGRIRGEDQVDDPLKEGIEPEHRREGHRMDSDSSAELRNTTISFVVEIR